MGDPQTSESTELTVVQPQSSGLQEWTPRFAISVQEAVELVEQKHEFFRAVMKSDMHYGVIPGTKSKPSLLKAGSELLLSSMGLRPDFEVTESTVDLTGEASGGEPLIRFVVRCSIWRQTGPSWPEDRQFIASGLGSCSSRETKYRYRVAQRLCPACGQPAIQRRKKEKGGGWQCIGNDKGGCWETFPVGDRRIEDQDAGKVLNPEIGDTENTILKMASKRAKVDGTLNATGCSDIFTQDIEDRHDHDLVDVDDYASGDPIGAASTTPPAARPPTTNGGGYPGEDMEALVGLAATLPNPKTREQILELRKTVTYKSLHAKLVAEHEKHHGPLCDHVAPPRSGPAPAPAGNPRLDLDQKLSIRQYNDLKAKLGVDDQDDGSVTYFKDLVSQAFAACGDPVTKASLVNLKVRHARWLEENAPLQTTIDAEFFESAEDSSS